MRSVHQTISLAVAFACVSLQTGCNHISAQKPVTGTSLATLELANPSNFPRASEPVYLSFYDLGVAGREDLVFVSGGRLLPTDLIDVDGDGQKDGIFTVLDFAAGEIRLLDVEAVVQKSKPQAPKRAQAEISVKRDGKWVPRGDGSGYKNYEGGEFINVEKVTVPAYYTDHSNWIRYEGPGIESDRVGYRIYLDGRNGFDIFGKSVAEPVLQQVGLDGYESYHHPQPWGMDLLKVGKSLGAGGFGYWDGQQLVHLQDVRERSAQILNNSNFYAGFSIDYRGWRVANSTTDVKAHFSMRAGSRLVKNQVKISGELANLAAGLVAHPNTQFIQGPQNIPGDAFTYIASWGPQSLDGQDLGMAIFFRRGDNIRIFNDGSSHIALLNPAGGDVTYYFAAAWQGENGAGIKTQKEFEAYLAQEAERLTRPLRQRVTTQLSLQAKSKNISAAAALAWSTTLADAELQRKTLSYRFDGWDVNRQRKPKFEYDIVGLLPMTYDELAKVTANPAYANVKFQVTASFITPDGAIRQYDKRSFNMDSVAPGRALLRVYREQPQAHYREALARLREQLRDHPKTANGAFWHKQIYPGQLWLDGVYMGMPFLAEYALLFEQGEQQKESLDEVVHEFVITEEMLKDPKTGLYFHAWDEYRQQDWADRNTGLSPQFWARGMGWLSMALVDVLDYLPQERAADRQRLIDMSVDLAKTLRRYQDVTGTWWQIMDRAGAIGNYRESSASAMFTYFLAKAVNRGYLTEQNFGPGLHEFVLSAYKGLIDEFVLVHPDGHISMTNQCYVAGLGYGRDGSYDYYMNESISRNDPKGTVPFMLAGIEMHKFLQKN